MTLASLSGILDLVVALTVGYFAGLGPVEEGSAPGRILAA